MQVLEMSGRVVMEEAAGHSEALAHARNAVAMAAAWRTSLLASVGGAALGHHHAEAAAAVLADLARAVGALCDVCGVPPPLASHTDRLAHGDGAAADSQVPAGYTGVHVTLGADVLRIVLREDDTVGTLRAHVRVLARARCAAFAGDPLHADRLLLFQGEYGRAVDDAGRVLADLGPSDRYAGDADWRATVLPPGGRHSLLSVRVAGLKVRRACCGSRCAAYADQTLSLLWWGVPTVTHCRATSDVVAPCVGVQSTPIEVLARRDHLQEDVMRQVAEQCGLAPGHQVRRATRGVVDVSVSVSLTRLTYCD